jgi:hypothetical protein
VETILTLMAVLGALAVAYRLLRALARLGVASAERTAASGLAEVSARRGDITSLGERRAHEQVARRRQRQDVLLVALWLAWLVVPPLIGWSQVVYAAAAPLWLLPQQRIRFQPPG